MPGKLLLFKVLLLLLSLLFLSSLLLLLLLLLQIIRITEQSRASIQAVMVKLSHTVQWRQCSDSEQWRQHSDSEGSAVTVKAVQWMHQSFLSSAVMLSHEEWGRRVMRGEWSQFQLTHLMRRLSDSPVQPCSLILWLNDSTVTLNTTAPHLASRLAG